MILTPTQNIYIHFIKRPIGFMVALLALILLSPLFMITILLLLASNMPKGGYKYLDVNNRNNVQGNVWSRVFFTQDRPGKNEKIFKAFKFKTMTDDRDAEGKLLPDAERLTTIGKFIRSTSIDELPQLINILKGDMAFIGPRPLLVQYLPLYTEEQHHRHDVSPGMSGWAQVNGRNNISWTRKFELDVYYVQHISLAMDVRVFFTTVRKVLLREDINQEGGEWITMDPFDGTN